jgi:hypothetical protein
MFITIIKSEKEIKKVEVDGESKYVAFEIENPSEVKRSVSAELMQEAYYQLFYKEKSDKLREEFKSLVGKKDKKSVKRLQEILNKEL